MAAMARDVEAKHEDSETVETTEEEESITSRPARLVPYRTQQVLISWMFILASATLLLDFLSLQVLLREGPSPDYFAELCNWFGVVSCLLWLLGFLLLIHWLHSVRATRMGLLGAYCKVLASVFFNLQPMTGSMNDPVFAGGYPKGGGAGTWWSNATGITFFHLGNIISCLDFFLHTPPGADKRKGWCFHGNLPITGMWIYQLSTWFLASANYLSVAPNGPTSSVLPTSHSVVASFQVVGASLLLIGSLFYAKWCDALDLQH